MIVCLCVCGGGLKIICWGFNFGWKKWDGGQLGFKDFRGLESVLCKQIWVIWTPCYTCIIKDRILSLVLYTIWDKFVSFMLCRIGWWSVLNIQINYLDLNNPYPSYQLIPAGYLSNWSLKWWAWAENTNCHQRTPPCSLNMHNTTNFKTVN